MRDITVSVIHSSCSCYFALFFFLTFVIADKIVVNEEFAELNFQFFIFRANEVVKEGVMHDVFVIDLLVDGDDLLVGSNPFEAYLLPSSYGNQILVKCPILAACYRLDGKLFKESNETPDAIDNARRAILNRTKKGKQSKYFLLEFPEESPLANDIYSAKYRNGKITSHVDSYYRVTTHEGGHTQSKELTRLTWVAHVSEVNPRVVDEAEADPEPSLAQKLKASRKKAAGGG